MAPVGNVPDFPWAAWASVGLGASVALSAWWIRRRPGGLGWSLLMACVSLALLFATLPSRERLGGLFPFVSWLGAGLCALWTLALIHVGRRGASAPEEASWRVARETAGVAALTCGLGAVIAALILLVMRLIDLVCLLLVGSPSCPPFMVSFPARGLVDITILLLCSWGIMRAGPARLPWSVPFWLTVIGATWPALSGDPADASEARFQVLSRWVHVWIAALSAAVTLFVILEGAHDQRRRWERLAADPASLLDPPRIRSDLRIGCGIVASGVMVLTAFYLATSGAPLPVHGWLGAGMAAPANVACGAAILTLVRRSWNTGLVDIGLGLMTLGGATLLLPAVPSEPPDAASRYPMVFNALMVGLGGMAWLWTWLSRVWEQQLDRGRAWTTAGRLIPHARRFAFVSACLAFLLGVLMALWPRLPSVWATDDRLGRLLAGVGGNLFLLWVALWCSRRLKTPAFHLLTLLIALSMAGFIGVRMIPFVSNTFQGASSHYFHPGHDGAESGGGREGSFVVWRP